MIGALGGFPYSIDEVQAMLMEIADELPDLFFRELNGGIILLEDCKEHPQGGNLLIMGDYQARRDLGRSIRIYYGSFMRAHGYLPEEQLREKLKATLLHEFTHHLESLAGERGLELRDLKELEEFRRRNEQ